MLLTEPAGCTITNADRRVTVSSSLRATFLRREVSKSGLSNLGRTLKEDLLYPSMPSIHLSESLLKREWALRLPPTLARLEPSLGTLIRSGGLGAGSSLILSIAGLRDVL